MVSPLSLPGLTLGGELGPALAPAGFKGPGSFAPASGDAVSSFTRLSDASSEINDRNPSWACMPGAVVPSTPTSLTS